MRGFTLLWQKILRSSLWVKESKETRLVWIAMLAMKDQDGMIHSSVLGLADAAKVTVEECRIALGILTAPDAEDTSGVDEGRRIREVQGGWQIVNHDIYRFSTEAKREFWKQQQADYRAAKKKDAPPSVLKTPKTEIGTTPPEDSDPVPKVKVNRIPTLEECKLQAAKIGLSELEAEKFFNYYEGNGWKTGKNPIKVWTACLTTWKLNASKYENNGRTNFGQSQKPVVPVRGSVARDGF